MMTEALLKNRGIRRRDFARFLAGAGGAALIEASGLPRPRPAPLPETPEFPNEAFWSNVRKQFLMPPELAVMNANASLGNSGVSGRGAGLRSEEHTSELQSLTNLVCRL